MTNALYKLPFLILIFIAGNLFSQQQQIDSLKRLLAVEKTDSGRINILWEISREYVSSRPDSALLAAQQGLFIAQKSNDKVGEMMSVLQMANVYQVTGNYSKSLGLYLYELKLAEAKPDADRTAVTLINIANLYQLEGDYSNALRYAKKLSYLLMKTNLINTGGTAFRVLVTCTKKWIVYKTRLPTMNSPFNLPKRKMIPIKLA